MDIQVRDITRDAWNMLIGQGETASVRKIYKLVGGKYGRVVKECRVLRQESDGDREGERAAAEPALETTARTEPKTYICTRYPEIRIRHIHFCDGVYETSEPEEQALIERNDWFGVFIFPG